MKMSLKQNLMLLVMSWSLKNKRNWTNSFWMLDQSKHCLMYPAQSQPILSQQQPRRKKKRIQTWQSWQPGLLKINNILVTFGFAVITTFYTRTIQQQITTNFNIILTVTLRE